MKTFFKVRCHIPLKIQYMKHKWLFHSKIDCQILRNLFCSWCELSVEFIENRCKGGNVFEYLNKKSKHNLSQTIILYLSWKSFVCLFTRIFRPIREFFNLNGDVPITGEGLQILTYVRHLWQLSSEGSLAWHTYCDTGHPFIMGITEDPWHSHWLPSV